MKHKFNFLAIALTGLFVVSCGKKEAPQMAPPATLDVVDASIKDVVGYSEFPASIEGKINNDVRAKIQGYIQQVFVHEGQIVTKGQPLFKIETNVLTESANAAKSGIASAQASVNVAQVEVNKLIPLVEKNIIGSVQLETAKANLESAKSMLAQARANYNSLNANIDFSVVRSPVNGIVGDLPFKNGSLVGPADPQALTKVSDVSEVFAYFSMNEKEYFTFLNNAEGNSLAEKLKSLPAVELVLADGSIYSEKGRIETVTGQVSQATGTVQFRVAFKNPQRLLSNGNSGSIRLPKYYKQVLVVPEIATYEQQGTINLYTVKNDTAYNKVIQITDRVDNMVIVKDGIKAGETVVVSGVINLRNQSPIKPKKVNFDEVVKSIEKVF